MRGNKALGGALAAITAAVVGVILNLAVWFAIHTMFRDVRPVHGFGATIDVPLLASVNLWAVILSACAAFAIFRRKAGMLTTLAACTTAGGGLYLIRACYFL